MHQGVFVNDVPGRFTQGYGVRRDGVGPFVRRFGFAQLALLSTESLTVGIESELPVLLKGPELARVDTEGGDRQIHVEPLPVKRS